MRSGPRRDFHGHTGSIHPDSRSLREPTRRFHERVHQGLESSAVSDALAGLRANEARYFHTKYGHEFTVSEAADDPDTVAWVAGILEDERGIVIASRPLQVTVCDVDGIHWVHVFYESGLGVNVLWTVEPGGKRAVGFKLSEGMDVPEELSSFKFARQKSKLAGVIRGSYFVIKGGY